MLTVLKVTILSPHFTVGAYNETIEYDDEMYPTSSNMRGRGGFGGLSSSWADGVHEKRNNYTSIIVEVIPEQPGEFKVYLGLLSRLTACLCFIYLLGSRRSSRCW